MEKSNSGWHGIERDAWNEAIAGMSETEALPKSLAIIDLEMMANYKTTKSTLNGKDVHPGEMLTSISKLAERWHWSRGKVKRYLAEKNGHQTNSKTGRLWTWIKVLGYKGFSDSEKSKRTTKRTANDTHLNNSNKSMRNADATATQTSVKKEMIAWDDMEDEGELTNESVSV